MTHPTAATDLFRRRAGTSSPELDIPLVTCPVCEKRRPMTIKAIVPRMRAREGAQVEYSCTVCGAAERRTVRPVSE